MQQLAGDRYLEIGFIVIGHRHHAGTIAVPQARLLQMQGHPRIRRQRGHIVTQVLQLDLADPGLVPVQHRHVLAVFGEGADQGLAGLAIAAHQVEGLPHAAHPARKQAFGDGALKQLVLQQRDDGADCVQPADNGEVQRKGHPQALGIAELVGDLAKPDGGGHEADEIEGMKDIHVPDIAVSVATRYQGHAEHRHRVDHHQCQQRQPHAAHDQKDDVVHPARPSAALLSDAA